MVTQEGPSVDLPKDLSPSPQTGDWIGSSPHHPLPGWNLPEAICPGHPDAECHSYGRRRGVWEHGGGRAALLNAPTDPFLRQTCCRPSTLPGAAPSPGSCPSR